MSPPATRVRFVGMLSSDGAEAVARGCIGALGPAWPEVRAWDVCVQPPLAAWPDGGYAVRVLAGLADGGLISIRSQGSELLETVREAFDGMGELLQQDCGGASGPGWLLPIASDAPSASA